MTLGEHYLKHELYSLVQRDFAWFDFLQESALDGLWYWDLERPEHEWMNPRFWKTLGYDPREMPHRSSAWKDLIHPDDLQRALENLERHCADPSHPYDQEVRYTHRLGHTVWIRCRGKVFFDPSGKPIRMLGAHTDITLQKQKEQELEARNAELEASRRELEAHYEELSAAHEELAQHEAELAKLNAHHQALLSALDQSALVAITDLQGKFLHVNEQFVRYTGYREDELIGQDYRLLNSGQHSEAFWRRMWQIILNGGCWREEVCNRSKQGDFYWVDNSISPVLDTNGHIYQYLNIGYPITERKWTENKLADALTLLERATRAVRMGVWQIDLVGERIHWSPMVREIHKVGPDYVPDKHYVERYIKAPEARTRYHQQFRRAVKEGIGFDDTFEIVNAAGETLWVRAIAIPEMHEGRCRRIYGLFQEVDKQMRSTQALAYQEERFRRTFEHAGNGIAMVGLDGSWLQVNERLCAMLQYSAEELLATNFQQLTHAEDLESDLQMLRETLAGLRSHYQMEKRYLRKDGSILWGLLSVALVRDEKGLPLHFVSQINDITLEKEAQLANAYLVEVQQEQNERLQQFAHIVSHNLRTHAGNIHSLLELIGETEPELAQHEYVQMLQMAGQNLHETIGELTEAVRSQARLQESLLPLYVRPYVDKVLQSVQSEIVASGALVHNHVREELRVMAVPSYLESILLNLITNALKYRHPERTPEVEIDLIRHEDFKELQVRDNGQGIDLSRHGDRLFGMYNTFHRHPEARGVGLYITKNQVEAMGGRIEVQSRPGEGTRFHVYLPRPGRRGG